MLLTMTNIWDWQRQVRLNRFSNANPLGSRINEIRYINEDDQALLLAGSSDDVSEPVLPGRSRRVGTSIGRYTITAQLGHGGMGDVLNFPDGVGAPVGCCGFNDPSWNLANAYKTDANGLPLLNGSSNSGKVVSDSANLYIGSVDPRIDWTMSRPGIPYLDWGIASAAWVRDPNSNGIFEPIWNRRYIDHVQISVAETVGVEKRGGYYDKAGALKDMVPNHIMQLISLIAMEPPISFEANVLRDEQAKVLHAIQPLTGEEVLTKTVRGQYGEGEVGGQHVPAYRSEPSVAPDSRTETFVAMKLAIDNWRWAGVPFYVRTGKRIAARNTHVVIQFRRAPLILFRDTTIESLMPNQLVLHIQPEEGISLRFAAKVPGPSMRLGSVDMDFEYGDYFGVQPSTGYERLLHDCMVGDATLFQRADMVEAGWSIVTPVLDVWKALPPRNFPNYPSGSWGPKEADELLTKDGRGWRNFEK